MRAPSIRRTWRPHSDLRVAYSQLLAAEGRVAAVRRRPYPRLAELGFASDLNADSSVFSVRTRGCLLTGPAGSGKTTTIYACLRGLAVNRDTTSLRSRIPRNRLSRA